VTPADRLRDLLAASGTVQVPAVHDGLTARLAEQAGFAAVFVSGNGVSAGLLGGPDLGLVTASESATVGRLVAAAVEVPVLHDADTGGGGVLNVVRTVRELRAGGLAGLTLEDQVTPKRCGLLDEPAPVVPAGDWLAKVEAAVWAASGELVVVARTDALRSLGLPSALERAREAARRGADAVLLVGLREPADVARVAADVDVPLVVLVEESGPLSGLTPDDLSALGVALAVHPATVRSAVAWAARHALEALRRDGTSAAVRDAMVTGEEWNAVLGLDRALELERRFEPGDRSPGWER
jgi:2-methylisocitrate lyase-like PEP mutase family enzyme